MNCPEGPHTGLRMRSHTNPEVRSGQQFSRSLANSEPVSTPGNTKRQEAHCPSDQYAGELEHHRQQRPTPFASRKQAIKSSLVEGKECQKVSVAIPRLQRRWVPVAGGKEQQHTNDQQIESKQAQLKRMHRPEKEPRKLQSFQQKGEEKQWSNERQSRQQQSQHLDPRQQQQSLQKQLRTQGQHQHQDVEHDHQLQRQEQRQQPKTLRSACSRPEMQLNVPSVVLELQKLSRLYTNSFRILSCHPTLRLLLQQRSFQDGKNATGGDEVPKLHRGDLPNAAVEKKVPDDANKSLVNADENGKMSRGKVVGEAACCDVLCRFELALTPTDPEFDKTALPRGLLVDITMGKDYPGADAIHSDASQQVVHSSNCGNALTCKEQTRSATFPSPVERCGEGGDKAVGIGAATPLEYPSSADAAVVRHSGFLKGAPKLSTSEDPDALVNRAPPHAEVPCDVSSVARLRVCNEEINSFRCAAIEMVFTKVIEKQMKVHEEVDLVRTALRAVDRYLQEIFQLEVTSPAVAATQKPQSPWTPLEQKRSVLIWISKIHLL